MQFGVSEYTLVFRRVLSHGSHSGQSGQSGQMAAQVADDDATTGGWYIIRPAPDLPARRETRPCDAARDGDIAEVLIVPFCSTLALDDLSYERFLRQSGVLSEALDLLGVVMLAEADSVETIRKEIQSLVMAAEVQYIVDGMSA